MWFHPAESACSRTVQTYLAKPRVAAVPVGELDPVEYVVNFGAELHVERSVIRMFFSRVTSVSYTGTCERISPQVARRPKGCTANAVIGGPT